jgi:cell division protein FtsI/penicillin-binding protein 2
VAYLGDGDHEGRELRNRFQFAFVVVVSVFTLMLFRLTYLQIIQGDRFRNLSESNRVRVRVVTAPRGIVYDARGRILVDNRPAFDVKLIPEDVKDVAEAVARVGRLRVAVQLALGPADDPRELHSITSSGGSRWRQETSRQGTSPTGRRQPDPLRRDGVFRSPPE